MSQVVIRENFMKTARIVSDVVKQKVMCFFEAHEN